VTTRLLVAAIVLCCSSVPNVFALDVAPGTTSATLQAGGCATASGAILGPCLAGCFGECNLADNEAGTSLSIQGLDIGYRYSQATAYTDFTVTPSPSGTATSLDATVSYDVAWAGGWTITGVATGWNDAKSTITLTLTDLTAGGTVVRSMDLHTMDTDGFLGIDLIDVGFGLDEGSTINTMDVRVARGHSYRLGLTMRCEGNGATNAQILIDYMALGWGAKWNDLKVTVGPDLAEEIEKLKRRVDALEKHTHTYLTGRGEGHNNTETETSKPILVVEEPTDEEVRILPSDDQGVEPLPVKSVFLANAPNPFNPVTTITYTLPEPLRVRIQLYNAQGQLARTLVDADRAAGPHAMTFDGVGLASGIYYYRLTAGRFTETRKLTLMR
jgi:hypothetical protein